MADPKWKRFERLIHQVHEQYGIAGAKVTLDDKIKGLDSKTTRQIDISIRTSVGPYAILIAIECKDHAQPLDVVDVGAFATLRQDVRAHKGVLVTTGGFTQAAIELARSLGIETRTYLDTESVDWGNEVTVPVVLDGTKLVAYQFTFSSVRSDAFLPFAMRTDVPVHLVGVKDPPESAVRPLILLLGRRWNNDESLHLPGRHTVLLSEHALVDARDSFGHARIEVQLIVERRFYAGPLGIHLTGFRDEQSESIHTQDLRTDGIEPGRIEQGLVPGWRELTEYRNQAITFAAGEPDAKQVMLDGDLPPFSQPFITGVFSVM